MVGLTAVFGMGTGVAPPLWSPGIVSMNAVQGRRTAIDSRDVSLWETQAEIDRVAAEHSQKRRGDMYE